jgi:hypothetical protein
MHKKAHLCSGLTPAFILVSARNQIAKRVRDHGKQ